MTSVQTAKLARLRDLLRRTGGCAVAYSGGVDSSLVLAVAGEVLGDRCLAVIATSSTYARRECEAAVEWVREQGIPYEAIESEELDVPGFRDNPPDRCYHCKKELFTKVREQARAHGLHHVADGTNADDARDYRPGMRAARELGVLTPLLDAGLTKDDIRVVAREAYQLPMADKPAMACMASRFPYHNAITPEKLRQVEAIEAFLTEQGFEVYRARHHGDILRLELGPGETDRILRPALREACVRLAKSLGFVYVTVDLEGYRTGSMNEPLARAHQPAHTSHASP
jgi:uncharacterized protein